MPMFRRSIVWLALVALVALAGAPYRASSQEDEEPEVNAGALQLEAIGGLSAVNAQHTYLLIGVVSDAHVKGAYEARQVRSMMRGVIRQLDAVSSMLQKLRDGDLSEEDDEYVKKIVGIYRLLQEEARALNRYVDKKGEGEAKAFEKARQAALKSIDELLGTDKPVAADTGDADKPASEPAEESPAKSDDESEPTPEKP